MLSLPVSWRMRCVNPTGTVDLMIITAPGLMAMTSRMTCSTEPVLK